MSLHESTSLTSSCLVFALSLPLVLLAPGCVAPKRATLFVPRRCLKVDAQSFTRPCLQRSDGKLVCDGVVVTASCVELRQ